MQEQLSPFVVTFTGLAIVFIILILLVFVIGLFNLFSKASSKSSGRKTAKKEQKLNKSQQKEQAKLEKKAAKIQSSASKPTKTSSVKPRIESGISGEIVAAITAAVYSVSGGSRPVLRSIRKSGARQRPTRPVWQSAGIMDNTRPF